MELFFWREFIEIENPVAAALLSQMDYSDKERVQVRVEFLRLLTRMKLEPAKMELLAVFFDAHLKLTPEEEEEFDRAVGKLDSKEVKSIMELTTSWHEKGRLEGETAGLQRGKLEGKLEETRAAIVEFLESRYGECPAGVVGILEAMPDLEQLKKLRREVFQANTLQEALQTIDRNY